MQVSSLQVKVVILGESGVGKSSLMLRFVTNNFKNDSASTVGASFMGKIFQVGEKSIKFNIWDTAGQERYHSLAKIYLHDASAAILLYDITKKSSFEALKKWHAELKDVAPKGVVIVICGNKEDLVTNEEVPPVLAKEYAKEIGAIFKKTSARNNFGIETMFKEIADKIFNTSEITSLSNNGSIALEKKTTGKGKKTCC